MLKSLHSFCEVRSNLYKNSLGLKAKRLKELLINKALKYRAYLENAPSCRDVIITITSPEYLKSKLIQVFNRLRLDMWIITGDEICSRQRLGIIYAGHETSKNFLIKLAFGNSYRENYIGKRWLWKIPHIVKEGNHDRSLMVTEVSNLFRIFFSKMKCFYIPFWVYGEFDFSVDNSSFFKKETLKSDVRKIRRNNLHYEVTDEPNQLHNFYYNMYTPYIVKAHGNRARIWSYDTVKRELRKHGKLLLVKKGKEYIAGILLRYKKNNRVKLCVLGIKDGNINYVKDGAIAALIYFSAHYSAEKGFARIDIGGSSSFLKDGASRYKKKWNQRISNKAKWGLLIKPLSKTDGMKGFFLNNPFIYKDKAGLNSALFIASDQSFAEEDFAKIYKDYYIEGLSKLVIYRFGEADSGLRHIVPPEFSDKITIRSAESIF